MYADREDVKDKEIKVRLNRFELDLIDEVAGLTHQQRAALMRELVLEGARSILEQMAAEKQKRNAA